MRIPLLVTHSCCKIPLAVAPFPLVLKEFRNKFFSVWNGRFVEMAWILVSLTSEGLGQHGNGGLHVSTWLGHNE